MDPRRSPNQYELSRNFELIAVLTIGGMIALAFVAITVVFWPDMFQESIEDNLIGYAVAGVVGFFVGCAALPFTLLFLQRKNVVRAMAIIYGVGFVTVVVHAIIDPNPSRGGIATAVSAFLAVVITSTVCRFLLNDDPRLNPRDSICLRCGFDLRGSPSGGCPECGWQRDRAAV